MLNTQIIAAFPATGKTTLVLQNRNRYIDSDSSNFSWLKDENGDNTKARNPDFPENYIQFICAKIGFCEAIFVSSHEVVRDALVKSGLQFTLVYPVKSLKKEYLKRFSERGNPKQFIELVKTNWEKWKTWIFLGCTIQKNSDTHIFQGCSRYECFDFTGVTVNLGGCNTIKEARTIIRAYKLGERYIYLIF
jgi:hypothetical protein